MPAQNIKLISKFLSNLAITNVKGKIARIVFFFWKNKFIYISCDYKH